MSQKDTKPDKDADITAGIRPVGLSFSSFLYAAAGGYYLIYPILVQDTGLIPLYTLGVISLVASFGIMRMTRLGLWLGLLVFPAQVAVTVPALLVTLQNSRLAQDYILIGFAGSLVALLFIATLSFLLVLDKRRTFK